MKTLEQIREAIKLLDTVENPNTFKLGYYSALKWVIDD